MTICPGDILCRHGTWFSAWHARLEHSRWQQPWCGRNCGRKIKNQDEASSVDGETRSCKWQECWGIWPSFLNNGRGLYFLKKKKINFGEKYWFIAPCIHFVAHSHHWSTQDISFDLCTAFLAFHPHSPHSPFPWATIRMRVLCVPCMHPICTQVF